MAMDFQDSFGACDLKNCAYIGLYTKFSSVNSLRTESSFTAQIRARKSV